MQFKTALHAIVSVPMKVLWLVKTFKIKYVPARERITPATNEKCLRSESPSLCLGVLQLSTESHISVIILDFSAGCMPKAFIVNPEEDLQKRNSKTASGNSMPFFFLLLLFPHIKQFIDFIVLA